MSRSSPDLTVGDVMTVGVETVTADETLQAAAEKMRARGVGMLLVMRGSELLGVITDRDMTVRASAAGLNPQQSRVHEAMTPQVYSCNVDSEIEEAARLMEESALRRLVVLDREGRPAGILSVDDLAVRLRDDELAGEVLGGAADPGRG